MVGHLPVVAIVDDEPHFRRALERLLINTGFEARQFGSGDEFLQHLEGIDCAILDLHMAGMSGFDVQKALATRRAPIPFLVLTGNDTPGNRSRQPQRGRTRLPDQAGGRRRAVECAAPDIAACAVRRDGPVALGNGQLLPPHCGYSVRVRDHDQPRRHRETEPVPCGARGVPWITRAEQRLLAYRSS
jgi:CheY-like chemotaxis protein